MKIAFLFSDSGRHTIINDLDANVTSDMPLYGANHIKKLRSSIRRHVRLCYLRRLLEDVHEA